MNRIKILLSLAYLIWPAAKSFYFKNEKLAAIMFFLLFLAIISSALSGCSTIGDYFRTSSNLDPKIYYRHDIKFEINDVKGAGIVTVRKGNRYKIKVTTPGKIDAIKFTSCHRIFSTEDVPGGWITNGKKYRLDYTPDSEMEFDVGCLMRVEAYEKGTPARHSSGIIEFENMPQAKALLAQIKCNGEAYGANGVGICQSWCPNGKPERCLKQLIEFMTPVELNSAVEQRCKIPSPGDGKTWLFNIRNRECTYIFRSTELEKPKYFRFVTIGFEEIAIRGN